MSLDILHAPSGILTGPELEQRLVASGWTKEPSESPGFVRYRCPRRYEHDRYRDGHLHVGPDGHRRVAFVPGDTFSVWCAVQEITREIDRLFGEPTTRPPLTFVPWIGVERAMPFAYCATCGQRQEEGVAAVVRLTNAGGGGSWLCLDCARAVGEMAAKVGGAR